MKPSAMKWHGHKKAGRIPCMQQPGLQPIWNILRQTDPLYDWNFQQPRGNSSRRNILSYVRYDDINIVLFKLIIKKTDC